MSHETEKTNRRAPRTQTLLLAVGLGLLSPGSAWSFDTGHHMELTQLVMSEQGFDAPAVQVVQVTNWLTDYYSQSPTAPDEVRVELEQLHFDNLYDTEDVRRYWGWLLHNTRHAAMDAASREDILSLLALLGVVTHATQDFYAHSSWVESHPRSAGEPYRRETWTSARPGPEADIHTGSYPPYPAPPPDGHPAHGDYDSGLNKDSHMRPRWAEAYVFAYCATHEILRLMEDAVEEGRPGLWRRLQLYRPDEKVQKNLDDDVQAAYKLSLWVKGKGALGHWKGSDSGSSRYLSQFALGWTAAPSSRFVESVKKDRAYAPLLPGLYGEQDAPPVPAPTAFTEPRVIVLMRTTYVAELRGEGRRIDRNSKADLYAVTRILSHRYVDRVLRNSRRYSQPWAVLHLAPADMEWIPILFEVWDQDEALGRQEDLCDIHPDAGRFDLRLRVRSSDSALQGDLEGIRDGPLNVFESAGSAPDRRPVTVRGYLQVVPLADTGGPSPSSQEARTEGSSPASRKTSQRTPSSPPNAAR